MWSCLTTVVARVVFFVCPESPCCVATDGVCGAVTQWVCVCVFVCDVHLQEHVERVSFPVKVERPEVTVDTTGLYLKYR